MEGRNLLQSFSLQRYHFENLWYAKEDATMEEIEAACRIVNIHNFISKQPYGYHAPVGNREMKLQKMRTAFSLQETYDKEMQRIIYVKQTFHCIIYPLAAASLSIVHHNNRYR